MDIQERTLGSVVVLDVSGRIVAGDSDGKLKDKVNSLIFQGHLQIVLNLGGVSYIDSNGLGEVVAAYATVSRRNGQIKLLNLTKRVQDLLAICRLLTVFDAYEDEASVLKSFSERAPV
jgi:anti-sigma B factor antagonist